MAQKTIFQTALTDLKDDDVEGVGTLRFDDKGKVYKWVQNLSSDTALVAGQPVCYSDGVAAATRFEGVVQASAAGDEEMFAGVAVGAIAAEGYGWIQCKGLCLSCNVNRGTSVAIVIGDTLKLASAAASLVYQGAGGDVPLNSPVIAMEAYASASTSATALKAVMLNCMT